MMSLHTVRLGLRRPAASLARTYSTFNQKQVDPQLDGYPQLPNESRQSLPPHGWWDSQMRRNFGDTVEQPSTLRERVCPELVTDA